MAAFGQAKQVRGSIAQRMFRSAPETKEAFREIERFFNKHIEHSQPSSSLVHEEDWACSNISASPLLAVGLSSLGADDSDLVVSLKPEVTIRLP
jgi:hypothetical protein